MYNVYICKYNTRLSRISWGSEGRSWTSCHLQQFNGYFTWITVIFFKTKCFSSSFEQFLPRLSNSLSNILPILVLFLTYTRTVYFVNMFLGMIITDSCTHLMYMYVHREPVVLNSVHFSATFMCNNYSIICENILQKGELIPSICTICA
jgi:hypothetical protein